MTAPLPKPETGPGPLRDFKDAVYALYLAENSPAPDDIRRRRGGEAPSTATIRDVISGSGLPSLQDAHAVVSALAPAEANRIRELWVRAAGHQPPGRPAAALSPVELGVHRAVHGTLPTYVVRPHDHVLRAVVARALAGESGIAVLVSGSSSGKTRALYEALHWRSAEGTLADWRVWPSVHPTDPRRMLEELPMVGARTVVWLNEAQRYLLDPPDDVRGEIAAELRALLADRARGPVLVLGTLWPRYWQDLTRTPQPGEPDLADVRLLVDGHGLPVPDTFSPEALAEAATSGDPALTEAARHAEDAAVTQYLAGVPDLEQRYELADQACRAVIHAAMDARRLGHGEWLPKDFLEAASRAFLDTRTRRLLDRDPQWFAAALAELTRVGRADTCVLLRDRSGRYRLDDYLDQLGRRTRAFDFPSQPFWDAATEHVTEPVDLLRLGTNAMTRMRYRIATNLWRVASEPLGLVTMARLRLAAGDVAAAQRLVDEATSSAVLIDFARQRLHHNDRALRELVLGRVLALGDDQAHEELAALFEEAGNQDAPELVTQGSEAVGVDKTEHSQDGDLVAHLKQSLGVVFGPEGLWPKGVYRAVSVVQQAASAYVASEFTKTEEWATEQAREGRPYGCLLLALLRDTADDQAGAEAIAMTAAELGHPVTLAMLATFRHARGDRAGAERCARPAAERGDATAMALLATFHADEELAAKAAAAGDPGGLVSLGRSREKDGLRLALMALNASALDARQRFEAKDSPMALLYDLYQPRNVFVTGLKADGSLETVPSVEW